MIEIVKSASSNFDAVKRREASLYIFSLDNENIFSIFYTFYSIGNTSHRNFTPVTIGSDRCMIRRAERKGL